MAVAKNLKQASAQRAAKAADKVASKTTKTTKTSNSAASKTTSSVAPSAVTTTTNGVAATIPGGLPAITPDTVAGMMPTFNNEDYAVADPLNPNPSMPQVTAAQHAAGMQIYEGAERALDLVGAAMDLTAKRFNVIGKQAKAVGAGVKAATQIEAVKGDVYDYLKQVETTAQKGIQYNSSVAGTAAASTIAIHTQADLDAQIELAQTKSETQQVKSNLAKEKLNVLKNELSQYLPQSR